MSIFRKGNKVAMSNDDVSQLFTDKVDNVTIDTVDGKIRANAIIKVDSLPTFDIRQNSLYELTQNITYTIEQWAHNGIVLTGIPVCYESISPDVEITVGGIYYNGSLLWDEVSQELVDSLVSNNLVGVCEFSQASFCGFNGKFDHESTFANFTEANVFSMTKLFKYENNTWLSCAVINLTQEQYDVLGYDIKNDGTIYIIDDSTSVATEITYDDLPNRPKINGILLHGSLSLEDLNLYSRSEVNALLENKGQIEFVDMLPTTPTTNTWYYSKKFEDGTDVPNGKRCLYIVDEDITVYHEMGIAGDIEMETGDTLSGSEHLVTSSQVVKNYVDDKLGALEELPTDHKDNLVSALNEVYDKCSEPFRVKKWDASWSNGIPIPACTDNTIENTQIQKMVFYISGEEGENYQIVGMIAYEVFDEVSGGNRVNCWPVCQFTGNSQKELHIRWCCMGTDTLVAKRISAWVLLKHR